MVKEMVLDVNDIKYNISPYSCSPNNKFPFYINTQIYAMLNAIFALMEIIKIWEN